MTSRNNECRLGRVIRLHDSQTISCQFLFQSKICWRNILLCIFSQHGISTMIEFTYMLFRQLYNSNPLRSQLNSLGQFHWERRFTSNVTYSGLFTMIYIGQIVRFETNIKNKLFDQSLTTETHFEKIVGLPHRVDVCARCRHRFIFYAYTFLCSSIWNHVGTYANRVLFVPVPHDI